ncbi:uncharacterized protein [Argopecten irradians]|uniref:uncharacterized protein n=1 Tax=Argopecten irradians TaxID=31199 RepID=UPI00371DBB2D
MWVLLSNNLWPVLETTSCYHRGYIKADDQICYKTTDTLKENMRSLLVLLVTMVAMVLVTQAQNVPVQPFNAVAPKPSKDYWPGPGALPPRPFMNFRPGMRMPPFMMPRKPQKGMFGGNNLLPMMMATNMIDEDMLPFMFMSGMGK